MNWSEWWVWAAGALILAIIEVLVPGYVFLGFAIGAGIMALVFLLGGFGCECISAHSLGGFRDFVPVGLAFAPQDVSARQDSGEDFRPRH